MFCVQLLVTACGTCTVIYRLMDFQRNIRRNSRHLAEFVLKNSLFNLASYKFDVILTVHHR